MSENRYLFIIDQFLKREIKVEDFIDKYFAQWKFDRDKGISASYDKKFQRIIDRIFTSCDCFSENPKLPIEITEEELRSELSLLRYIWWG